MIESIFKVLSDKNRLRIINLLLQNDLCVCEIEIILQLNQSNVSRNLRLLRKNNFVETRKDAQWIHYEISSSFKKENVELIKYLENVFKDNKVFIKDLERFKKYRDSDFNCQIIGDNRTNVLEILK